MILNGNSNPNGLQGGDLADLIHGRGGNDQVTGWGGDDTLYGDAGNDLITGDDGNDKLYGGDGNDTIYDDVGTNYFNGGYGRDVLSGGGTLIGGWNDDRINLTFGAAYGDNLKVASAVGNDVMITQLEHAPGQERSMTGGRGADQFQAHMDARDGIATRLEVRDFNSAQGDHLYLDQHAADGSYQRAIQTFTELDVNGDHMLTVADGAGASGSVHADPEGLAIQGLDGDAMILVGRSLVYAGDFIMG